MPSIDSMNKRDFLLKQPFDLGWPKPKEALAKAILSLQFAKEHCQLFSVSLFGIPWPLSETDNLVNLPLLLTCKAK